MARLNPKAVLGTFLDAESNPQFDKADVVTFGVSFDLTSSYGKGACFGPYALFDASQQLEWEVPVFHKPLNDKVIIHNAGVLEYPEASKVSFEDEKAKALCVEMVSDVRQLSEKAIKEKKLLFVIGGEHSVTNGVIDSIAKLHDPKDVCILQFDAHLDLRDEHWDSKLSHACVMKRALDKGFSLIQLGIRDRISGEEISLIKRKKLAENIFFCPTQAEELYGSERVLCRDNLIVDGVLSRKQVEKILSKIDKKYLYISVDIDALDSSIAPATGTPMPGGLMLKAVQDMIFATLAHAKKKDISFLGFDICEVAPQLRDPKVGYEKDNVISNITEFNSASLAYDILFWNFLERFKK
jgi:agmatinase